MWTIGERGESTSIHIDGAVVEWVETFKFFGVHICKYLTWSTLTRTVLKRMGPQILKKLYSCIIAWYGNSTALDRKALQKLMQTAQYITGAELPAIQDLYIRRCERKARKIVKDSSCPSHKLFSLLPVHQV